MKVEFKTDNLMVRIPTEKIRHIDTAIKKVEHTRITLDSGDFVEVNMKPDEVMEKIKKVDGKFDIAIRKEVEA